MSTLLKKQFRYSMDQYKQSDIAESWYHIERQGESTKEVM